jgi:DNA polymerase
MSKHGIITKDYLTSGKYHVPILHLDIEVLPHWWSIVIRHKGISKKYRSDTITPTQHTKLFQKINKSIITAYNGKRYDFKILYAIKDGLSPEKIYEISQAIIENDGESDNYLIKKYLTYSYWSVFDFIDLYDDITGTLKEHESNMGISILESTVPFGKENLTIKDKLDLLAYNEYDVIALEKLFIKRLNNYLLPKLILAERYHLDPVKVFKDTNAKLTAKILGAKPLPKYMLVDKLYKLPKNIETYVKTYVPSKILDIYLNTKMDRVGRKTINVKDFENKVKFGKGGLHSVMREYMRITNKNYKIFLIDVRSYYPNLMIWFDFLSNAVKNRETFPEIYDSRLISKANKNKLLDKALKLILNTTFGAQGQRYNPLYDPNNAWSITITGQLLLYSLAKEIYLHSNGKIIQTNTDGIVVAIQEKNIPKLEKIVSNWEDMTKLEMEYEEIEVFAQANVNNYACKFTNGKTKVKGGLVMQAITCDETAYEVVTFNNLDMRIVHEAVFRFLIYKEPIEKTIKKCTDLKMFLSTCKTGGTYKHTYHYVNGKKREVQKVNRVLAVKSKKLGTLKKFKIDNGKDRYDKIGKISEHCYIMNKNLSEYDWGIWKKRIDYNFYIKVAKDKVKGWLK